MGMKKIVRSKEEIEAITQQYTGATVTYLQGDKVVKGKVTEVNPKQGECTVKPEAGGSSILKIFHHLSIVPVEPVEVHESTKSMIEAEDQYQKQVFTAALMS